MIVKFSSVEGGCYECSERGWMGGHLTTKEQMKKFILDFN